MPLNWKTFRPALLRAVFRIVLSLSVIGTAAGLFHPDTPLPDEWNPAKPLQVSAPVTAITGWKLRHAMASDSQCLRVLGQAQAGFIPMPPLQDSVDCFIQPRVQLRNVGQAGLRRVETRCQTALLMAMWERHGLQAAAQRHLGTSVSEIRHYSSYSCREMRTGTGEIARMSTHATADAMDVSGFVMGDGTEVNLRRDWPGSGPNAAFLRDALQSACLWFPVALGPDFNALHADHFHLQTGGWGFCR